MTRLAAVDLHALQAGLRPGQSLSDARALCPELQAREIDHRFLTQVFAQFADWHSYASPIVSILTEQAPYGDLMLDITGVAHLFGHEQQMLSQVRGRLTAPGFMVQAAIGPTIGTAWALAHFAPDQVVAHDPTEALEQLPVAALRLEEAQVSGLNQMGLKRVGQLYGRDRKALQARFGVSLLRRLDQALGFAEERLTPRLPVPERVAERRFAEPICLLDDVLLTASDLAQQIAAQLEAEGLGAQSFHLWLYRVDNRLMSLSVNAARATRDWKHIARLFAHRVERLRSDFDAGFGIELVRLGATSVSGLDTVQTGLLETDDGAWDLDQLYDRIVSRLGPKAVLRPKALNSYIPERAAMLEPVVARTPDDPVALMPLEEAEPLRPLRLLPRPEEITVTAAVPDGPPARMVWRRVPYRFLKASGPERIGVEWWQPGDGAMTRDYYVAEDEEGRRFWLFREGLYATESGTPGWFLHGFFA